MPTIFILFFIVFSPSIFATKARMQSLGQDTSFGSLFFSDTRSIFKNPAYITQYSNSAIFEFGSGTNNADSEAAPHAEGGAIVKIKDLFYGLYFGNENDAINSKRRDANARLGETQFLAKDNVVQAFLSGGDEFKWGLSVQNAYNDDNNTNNAIEKEHNSWEGAIGFLFHRFELYTRLVILDKNEGGSQVDDSWSRKRAATVGMAGVIKNNNFYLEYKDDGFVYDNQGVAAVNYENKHIRVGWGKVNKINSFSHLFMNAYFYHFSEEFNNNTTVAEHKLQYLPVVVGIESRVRYWLTLRTSVEHRLFAWRKGLASLADSTFNQQKLSLTGQTFVNAGASLNFGKIHIDGVLGTTTLAAGRAPGNTAGGVLAGDNLMSRVSMLYSF